MDNHARILAAIETAWEVLQERHPDLPDVRVVVDAGGARHNLAWPEAPAEDARPELPVRHDTLRAGPRALVEQLLHLATHALCTVRGVNETSNRGIRHNKRFRETATELGMAWPQGEAPHPSKGFSPVPLTAEGEAAYAPLIAALDATLAGVSLEELEPERTGGRSGVRLTLRCECVPARSFQIGPTVAATGPIVCGVCGKEFTEK
ncbi:hypothetical protein ADL21_18215 [Streptomyces albus subsp. albus]|nr:hypothetical protein ADL21_18215 [Streptomyces albus subsp. albus]